MLDFKIYVKKSRRKCTCKITLSAAAFMYVNTNITTRSMTQSVSDLLVLISLVYVSRF
jgi:hypothetical protein